MIDGPDKNFEAYMDEETGEYVYDAFNYTAHGRLAEDWKAYPMPLAVWDLGVAVYEDCQMQVSSVLTTHYLEVLFNGIVTILRPNR